MLKEMLPSLSEAIDCKSNLTLSNGPLLVAVIGIDGGRTDIILSNCPVSTIFLSLVLPLSFPSTETGRGWGHKRLKLVAIILQLIIECLFV